MENSIEAPQKIKNSTTIWSKNFTSGYIFRENERRYKKNICIPMFFFNALFIYFSWCIVDLQYYISFRCIAQWFRIFINYIPLNIIIKQWLYFPMLCNIALFLIYFIHSNLYLFIPHPYLPLCTSLFYKFVLYICESVSVLLNICIHLFHFLSSTKMDNSIFLSLT